MVLSFPTCRSAAKGSACSQAKGAQAETRSFCGNDSGTATSTKSTSSAAIAVARATTVSIP